jgi:hypothetical protein
MSTKRKRAPRKNGKPWPNNIGRWLEKLPTDKRAQLFQRAARAQWGPEKQEPKKADDGPWVWPIDLNRYDRSSALTAVEKDTLTRYAEAYRFYRFGRHMDFGPALDRLVCPLNEALDYTGIRTNYRRYTLLLDVILLHESQPHSLLDSHILQQCSRAIPVNFSA